MKQVKIFLFAIIIGLSINANAQDNTSEKVHHVVMQLNTADTAAWSSVMGNIRNFQKIWPGKVEIEGEVYDAVTAGAINATDDVNDVVEC